MKNKYFVLYFLTFFPLVMVGITFLATPGAVFPMQYGGSGEVYRWGNKFELYIYAMIPLILGIGTKIYIAKMRKKEEIAHNHVARNEKIALTTAKVILLVFNMILLLLLGRGYFVASQKPVPFGFHSMKIAGILIGIIFIAIGNYLPKSGYKSILGVRTPWSVKNEAIWIQTQKGCGIILMLLGVVAILYSLLFLNESSSGVYILGMILFTLLLLYGYSYFAYRVTPTRS